MVSFFLERMCYHLFRICFNSGCVAADFFQIELLVAIGELFYWEFLLGLWGLTLKI